MRSALWRVLLSGVSGLDLDFARNRYALNGGYNTAFPSGWSFTRASVGTALTSTGSIIQFASGVPRITDRGLLVEESRTNLLLNSATLSTQSVTTTAVAHTLSFYGTGTVTLTGTSTAGPLVGTGANNLVSLTFTPTAGTLTLTVTGSVTTAQLEAGSFATSYIPTTGATVTRAADSTTMGSFVFPAAYTCIVETQAPVLQTGSSPTSFSSTGTNVGLLVTGSTNVSGANMGNATFNDVYGSAVSAGGTIKNAFRAETNNARGCLNGTLSTLDATFTPVVGSQTLNIGAANGSANYWNSYVQRIRVLPYAVTDAQLQALTS